MDTFIQFLREQAPHAHWFIFLGIILAGLNIPVSIDLMMIVGATLAATIIPENKVILFFSIFFGCMLSAWISYWIGRKLGPKLRRFSFFAKLLSPERIEKVRNFYSKYGFFALIIGRFIPFGVRNCIFMSSGISRMPFGQFVLRDVVACSVWSLSCFSMFYLLGKNFDTLYNQVKIVNLILFIIFIVAVMGFIWYKKRKKKHNV